MENYLIHYGVKGMKWRRHKFQVDDREAEHRAYNARVKATRGDKQEKDKQAYYAHVKASRGDTREKEHQEYVAKKKVERDAKEAARKQAETVKNFYDSKKSTTVSSLKEDEKGKSFVSKVIDKIKDAFTPRTIIDQDPSGKGNLSTPRYIVLKQKGTKVESYYTDDPYGKKK